MSVSAARVGDSSSPSSSLNIGQVVQALQTEFADITLSKIRFLEERGLVHPTRSTGGYRQYTALDVERLRYVLTVQRDYYVPLRIIRDYMQALDQGQQPPNISPVPVPPRLRDASEPARVQPPIRLTANELMATTGSTAVLHADLVAYGLIQPDSRTGYFDSQAQSFTRLAVQLSEFGITPRHIRATKTTVDREAGLIDQVVAPARRRPIERAHEQATETAREIAALLVHVHAALLEQAMRQQ